MVEFQKFNVNDFPRNAYTRNEPELIHFSYMRFLENRLRESFGFEGTPIRLILRGKKREDEE